MRAALRSPRAPPLGHAQVAGVHLAALAHPLRRRPLVGDAHLIRRVGEQPFDDGGADRAGAAGDQHPAHRAGSERGQLRGVGEHLGGAPAVPGVHHQAVAAGPLGDRGERPRIAELRVVGGHDDRVGTVDGLLERHGRRGHVRVVHGDVGQLALEQADQLVRERVALVVGVGLEGQPEHGDLAVREARPRRRLTPRAGTAARTRSRARRRAASRARPSAPRRTRSPCAGTSPRSGRAGRSRRGGSRG